LDITISLQGCFPDLSKEKLVRSRLGFWKYPIFIVLLLSVIATFTLIYAFNDTATAPYEQTAQYEPVVMETPEPPEPHEESEDITEDEPEEPDEPEDIDEYEPEEIIYYPPPEGGFVTIQMDPSEIHEGYLILVNHSNVFIIPDDIELVKITDVRTPGLRVRSESLQLAPSIVEPLNRMIDDFISETNIRTVAVISAFRTLEYQQNVLDSYIARIGRWAAQRQVSPPGHSEHHTGLAFDFGIISGGVRSTFDGSGRTAWIRQNAHNYGFILRYPPGKTHITRIMHEPWHFRYVGLPHSIIIYENNWCFEEYIEKIREHTIDEPFVVEADGVTYEIYSTTETDVPVPFNSEFDISGNNVDGFIVTTIRFEYEPGTIIDVST